MAAFGSIAAIRTGFAKNRDSERLLWPIPDVEWRQFGEV